MNVTVLNKGDRHGIGWVKKAASKDTDRMTLNYLQIKDGVLSACDGFRIHRWIYPEKSCLSLLEDGCYEMTVLGKYLVYGYVEIDKKYPDIDAVCHTTKLLDAQKELLEERQIFKVDVNPRFLAEALALPGIKCTVLFGGIEQIICDQRDEDQGVYYAVFMPMHIDNFRYYKHVEIYDNLPWNIKRAETEASQVTEA